MTKISPGVDDLHLFGGLDAAATLSTGAPVIRKGLLSEPRTLCLVMAERCPPDVAARLCQWLDTYPDARLIALDEGADDDEHVADALSERMAFFVAPEGHAPDGFSVDTLSGNKQSEPAFSASDVETVTWAAWDFGVISLRAPSMVLTAAACIAQLGDRCKVTEADLAEAAALVLSHRATCVPDDASEPDDPPPAEQTPPDATAEQDSADQGPPLDRDMLVNAVLAQLPPELLAGLGRLKSRTGAHGTGAGQKRLGNRRGRPLPARPGRLDGRHRLDLLATLRAAAPWQRIRAEGAPTRRKLHLRSSDFRVKRYETKSDRALVFCVDASGSAAISRLNEAKGAIELLLGQAYAARDHVALVSFRGAQADCLLEPTRSLVQTKRKLTALPGGGGTPLAAGLREAMLVAHRAKSRGMTPVIVLVTDGKGNVALDGTPNRQQAREDATSIAHHIRADGLDVLIIDMSVRPQPQLRDLAQHLDCDYMPLPRADAHRLSGAVRQALDHA